MNNSAATGGFGPPSRRDRRLLLQRLRAREIVAVDFEYGIDANGLPDVRCVVAHEIRSGRVIRLSREELLTCTEPPFAHGYGVVMVAYYASAEVGCFLTLGWPLPTRVLDLFAEFRNLTNGSTLLHGAGLLGALAFFGLPVIGGEEKDEMRALALRGGPYSDAERAALLDYCETDVVALVRLLPYLVSASEVEVHRAFLRGRYTMAVARMERAGIPVELPVLDRLRTHWEPIQRELVAVVDRHYGVFDGIIFREKLFREYVEARHISWPRHSTGRLMLDADTFKSMVAVYPDLRLLHELRETLAQMRLTALAVWGDGRNRVMLSMFRARTGRNQPSNSKFIFGTAVWLRCLIRPRPGYALAYVDWSQQEFGIAAALSGDPAMAEAYTSGDPYLAFAKQAGAVPPDATRGSHKKEREQFKACVLAVQYGMGAESLAHRIGQPVSRARELLRLHRETYPVFWAWSDRVVNHGQLSGSLHTAYGWNILVGGDANERSLRNFPMQGNGAEMLRLACCFVTERGTTVCAPVHDALLIEAPEAELEEAIATTQEAMAEASGFVLDGFRLRSDVKVIRSPDRYEDERGTEMWNLVMAVLAVLEKVAGGSE
jgi:DNA polymerase-1